MANPPARPGIPDPHGGPGEDRQPLAVGAQGEGPGRISVLESPGRAARGDPPDAGRNPVSHCDEATVRAETERIRTACRLVRFPGRMRDRVSDRTPRPHVPEPDQAVHAGACQNTPIGAELDVSHPAAVTQGFAPGLTR